MHKESRVSCNYNDSLKSSKAELSEADLSSSCPTHALAHRRTGNFLPGGGGR